MEIQEEQELLEIQDLKLEMLEMEMQGQENLGMMEMEIMEAQEQEVLEVVEVEIQALKEMEMQEQVRINKHQEVKKHQ